jgi:hypothetical protein
MLPLRVRAVIDSNSRRAANAAEIHQWTMVIYLWQYEL